MEEEFSVKVIPTLLQEAQFLTHYFSPVEILFFLLVVAALFSHALH